MPDAPESMPVLSACFTGTLVSLYDCIIFFLCSKNMDVDEVTIDATANWTPVEKPLDSKDEEGTLTNWMGLVNLTPLKVKVIPLAKSSTKV